MILGKILLNRAVDALMGMSDVRRAAPRFTPGSQQSEGDHRLENETCPKRYCHTWHPLHSRGFRRQMNRRRPQYSESR